MYRPEKKRKVLIANATEDLDFWTDPDTDSDSDPDLELGARFPGGSDFDPLVQPNQNSIALGPTPWTFDNRGFSSIILSCRGDCFWR